MAITVVASDGVNLPIGSLALSFEWNGDLVESISTEYAGNFYKKSFTYFGGFSIASITVNTPGSFKGITISTTPPGAGASFTPTMGVDSATASAIGTGYTVDDVLTIVGGMHSVTGQVKVATINGSGGITGLTVQTVGSYTVLPVTQPLTVIGGTGTGATINAFFKLLAVSLSGDGGAGYTVDSTIVFTVPGGSTAPTGTIVLSSTSTSGNVQSISSWVLQEE